MTDTTSQAEPKLWTLSGFQLDQWHTVESADELSDTGHVILPFDVFLGLEPERRRAANTRLGVRLKPADPVEKIGDLLDEIAVVALEFPTFSDGRSFSKAEILRRRYGYKGKVRAVGQVLPDQLSHMLRVGFDELEVSHPVSLRWLQEGKVNGLGLYGQPSARHEADGPTYSWRRRPAAGA